MPEGDTIFRAATALRKALQGARVTQFRSVKLGRGPVGEQPVAALVDEALAALVERSHRLLVRNRTAGPRSTRNAFGAVRFWVYGRSAEPCFVCGETVRVKKTQRITYYCPRCQLDLRGRGQG